MPDPRPGTSSIGFRPRLCENVARYDCTRNFEACGHVQIKKMQKLSSAQHYDQMRFRFYTGWTPTRHKPGGNPAAQQSPALIQVCYPSQQANPPDGRKF